MKPPADIREILATRAKMVYPYRINFSKIGYDNLSQMKKWCEDNCSYIWNAHSHYALYFQFSNERDATMFVLRWGSADGNIMK